MRLPASPVRLGLGLVALLALGTLPVTAAGQPAAAAAASPGTLEEQARALFGTGLEHVDRGEWAQAETLFRQAQAVRPSPVIAYNLGLTLIRLGRLVEATTALADVALDASAPERIRTSAVAARGGVEGKIARLTVRLNAEGTPLRIELDGRTVAAGEVLRVDPGTHAVRGLDGAREVTRAEVTLSEGESREITLAAASVASLASPSPDVGAARTRPRPRSAEGSVLEQWWFWAAVGGVLAAGTASAVVLSAGDDPVRGDAGFEWTL